MILSQGVYALTAIGSTFSYVTPFIVGKFDKRYELLSQLVEMSTLVGDSL